MENLDLNIFTINEYLLKYIRMLTKDERNLRMTSGHIMERSIGFLKPDIRSRFSRAKCTTNNMIKAKLNVYKRDSYQVEKYTRDTSSKQLLLDTIIDDHQLSHILRSFYSLYHITSHITDTNTIITNTTIPCKKKKERKRNL
jgi:hypothetical protein